MRKRCSTIGTHTLLARATGHHSPRSYGCALRSGCIYISTNWHSSHATARHTAAEARRTGMAWAGHKYKVLGTSAGSANSLVAIQLEGDKLVQLTKLHRQSALDIHVGQQPAARMNKGQSALSCETQSRQVGTPGGAWSGLVDVWHAAACQVCRASPATGHSLWQHRSTGCTKHQHKTGCKATCKRTAAMLCRERITHKPVTRPDQHCSPGQALG